MMLNEVKSVSDYLKVYGNELAGKVQKKSEPFFNPGNKWDEKKCNCNNNIGNTTQVGKYSPKGDSPYGCSDLAGNVLEWTSTTIGTKKPWPTKYNYPYNPNDGREDLTTNTRRVARGGTYQRNKDFCRCAFRFADIPSDRYSSMGFRVICKD